ncbi:ZIP Zinc transporter protein [Spraguea lophii 42_110]|uniref:ZIP Zinc transporter protein n=1 Tax=Spraguea lophii (strain 42_110) TaxID=1358809 RepID=S7W7V6_SPRLO|nr:ZIP Zinc transporter protein [Spraguea lophii 42_110]
MFVLTLPYTLLASFCVFIFTLFFALLSKLIKDMFIPTDIKCFAGGIILSTTIFHILPDIYLCEDNKYSWLAPLCAGLSFLVLFSIDKLYLYTENTNEIGCTCGAGQEIDENVNDKNKENREKKTNKKNGEENYHNYEKENSTKRNRTEVNDNNTIKIKKICTCEKVSDKHENDTLPTNSTRLQATIFIVALSVHSFLEGLGISSKNGKQLMWYMVSLLGHKWIEAFVLGVSIFSADFARNMTIFLLLFYSSLTSIGILIGYALLMLCNIHADGSSSDDAGNISTMVAVQILTGLSSGSFFYIGFIEMLGNVFGEGSLLNKNRRKLVCVFTGFTLMATVCIMSGLIENGVLFKSWSNKA